MLPELGFRPVKGNSMVFCGTPTTPSAGVKAQFTGENEERDKNFRYLLYSMLIGVDSDLWHSGHAVQQLSPKRDRDDYRAAEFHRRGAGNVGLWFPFSLASFIGLVSLTGIVVNDAIVLVDFTNQARKRGLPLREAIVEAGVNRLRPVLLTTITTIGGLLPLLLNISGGAEFWQPLTAAVVFGLAFATVLTLVVIPVVLQRGVQRWASNGGGVGAGGGEANRVTKQAEAPAKLSGASILPRGVHNTRGFLTAEVTDLSAPRRFQTGVAKLSTAQE